MPAGLSSLAGDRDSLGIGPDSLDTRTTDRLRARGVLRDLTTLKYPRRCGLYGLGGSVAVKYGSAGGVAGLETCGSVWACPFCSAKIAHHRQQDMQAAMGRHIAEGGAFALLTLTLRHRRGQPLDRLWDSVSGAWRKFTAGRSYQAHRRAAGVAGYHRTTEVTLGENGWHVHLHVLYFLNAPMLPDSAADFGEYLTSRWAECVTAVGRTSDPAGQDWKILHGSADALEAVAGYVHKGIYTRSESVTDTTAIALEVTRSDLKDARVSTSLAPFGLLASIVHEVEETGAVPSRALQQWHEWERASKGRRQQIWSRGLRSRLGLDEELTDEQAAALPDVSGVVVARIANRDWRRFFWDGRRHAYLMGIMRSASSAGEARWLLLTYLQSIGCPYEYHGDADDGPAMPRGARKLTPALVRSARQYGRVA
jgi:Replication protein